LALKEVENLLLVLVVANFKRQHNIEWGLAMLPTAERMKRERERERERESVLSVS